MTKQPFIDPLEINVLPNDDTTTPILEAQTTDAFASQIDADAQVSLLAAAETPELGSAGGNTGDFANAPMLEPAATALATIQFSEPEQIEVTHHQACACPGCCNIDDTMDGFDAPGDEAVDGGAVSAGAVATLGEMADYLHEGYFGRNIHFNLSDTGTFANSGQLLYNVSGFSGIGGLADDLDGLVEGRRELVREAFKVFGETLGIDFVETTAVNNDVDFYFADNNSGAYAGSYRASGGEIDYSYLNIAASWSGSTSTYDDYTLQTIFHEIGHALGLGHQGNYNGSANYQDDALFDYDNWQASMMSYFSQTANDTVTASYEFLQTPMAVDWIALQTKYGSQSLGGEDFGVQNAFLGDTVYGFNTNISSATSDIWANFADWADRTASTIVDGGGNDTIDFSGYSGNTNFDLSLTSAGDYRPAITDVSGRIGNLTLAEGTVIENAIGGSGNDTFIGNAEDNVMDGRGGNDSFTDSAGNDTYLGGAGTDEVDFTGNFSSYSFSISGSFLQVINVAVDLLEDTIENLAFDDQTITFATAWSIALAGGNTAPNAVGDAYVFASQTYAANVLANDTDADDDDLTVTALNGSAGLIGTQVTLASGALLTLNANGTFSYNQNGAFDDLYVGETALETFSYTISDGLATDTANVSLTIQGQYVNQGPQANNDSFAVTEDASLSGMNVLGNDSDPEDDALSITRIAGVAVSTGDIVTLASGAQVQLQSGGTLRFIQNGAYDALDVDESEVVNFSYTISDGDLTDQANVAITVNGAFDNIAPHAMNDTASTAENETVAGNVLTNDSDDDGHNLTIVAVNNNTNVVGAFVTLASGALVRVNADGTYTYDPNGAFNGLDDGQIDTDSFTYRISDGFGGEDTARVTVEITGLTINTAPNAVNDGNETSEDQSVSGNVLGNDSDPENDTLTVTAINGSTAGIGGFVLLASGARVQLNADGTYVYDPNGAFDALNSGETATDSFNYRIEDGQGGSDTATVTLDISGVSVNTGPNAVSDSATTSESQSISGNVLTNDSDPDGDDLSVIAIEGSAAGIGSFVTLASGARVQLNANGSYVYDPNGVFDQLDSGQTATDSFDYRISDGAGGEDTATVSIEITGAGGETGGTVVVSFEDGINEDGFVFTGGSLTDAARGVSDGAQALASDGNSIELERADGDNFAFVQAVFTPQSRGNKNLSLTAYDDGVSIGTQLVRIKGGRETEIQLDSNLFGDVDQVTISARGGIVVDELVFEIA